MNKRGIPAHALHTNKKTRFNQPKPASADLRHAPQEPAVGTNAKNQFR